MKVFSYRMSVFCFVAAGIFALSGAVGCGDEPIEQKPPVCDDPEGCDPPPVCDEPDGCDPPPECEDYWGCDVDLWPTEGLWDESVVPIPCTGGELCYRRDLPLVVERLPAYRAWLLDVEEVDSDDYSESERERIRAHADAVIEATHRLLESCNYFRDGGGALRVECPEKYRELASCPHMWFLPEMTWVGVIPAREGVPAYCLEDVTLQEGKACAPTGCDEGLLCSGSLTAYTGELAELVSPIYSCVERALCLELREEFGVSAEDSCLQSNLQPATRSTLDDYDCDALEEGLCAVNCPCALPEQQCQLLTENQPIGLCSTSYCSRTNECGEGEGCALSWTTHSNPLWSAYVDSPFVWLFENYVVHSGICAPTALCARAKQLSPQGSDLLHYSFSCSGN